ncbi:MAG TPA: ribosome silencing factor [Rubrobacteraceae bacterium]|nr:ribosome silencing factor [Rubrobacteraceae bacterium]
MTRDEFAARRQVDEARGGLELTRRMAETAARAAAGMFARDVVIIDLREAVSYTDYFVVASAETERQMRRIVEEILEKMNEQGYRPRSRRFDEGSAWISLDFLDVVVHIFTDEARDYYRLESFWRAAPQEYWEE